MTPQERTIARAAIAAPHARTFEEIYSVVAEATGIEPKTVKHAITHLANEAILRVRVTPAINRGETPDVPRESVEAWYEKGELWADEQSAAS
jgi:NaMN:DMB phosphoribosyltransferase